MGGHEAAALNAVVRLEHHEQFVGRRRNGMRQLGTAEATQSVAVGRVTVVDGDVIVCAFL